jgi:RNA recognition motif-containing protein
VGRLPEEAQAQDLRRLFEQYGVVTECDILNRYGFVHMKTEEMAVRAIKELNNAEFMGVQISVEVLVITLYFPPRKSDISSYFLSIWILYIQL